MSGEDRRDDPDRRDRTAGEIDPHLWDLYALDALEADETDEVERYLAACGQRRRREIDAYLAETRGAMAYLVGATVDPVAPPDVVRSRVLDELARIRQRPAADVDVAAAVRDRTRCGERPSTPATGPARPPVGADRTRGRRGSGARVAALAAAAVVLLAGGVLIGRATAPRPTPVIPGEVSALLSAPDLRVAQAEVSTGGTTAVMASRSRDVALVMLNGVAEPRPGHAYRVWMLHDGRPPVPTEEFVDPADSPRGAVARLDGLRGAVGVALSEATIDTEPDPDETMMVTVALP